jgi:uncharacterized membrane protein
MAFCIKCGANMADNVSFCSACGQQVNPAPQVAPAPQPNQAPPPPYYGPQNAQFAPPPQVPMAPPPRTDFTSDFEPEDIEENYKACALAYTGYLFFLPLLTSPKSKFARFHANQGLLVLLTTVALGCAFSVLYYLLDIPISLLRQNYVILSVFSKATTAIEFAVWVMFIVFGFVTRKKAKLLPVLGKIKIIK